MYLDRATSYAMIAMVAVHDHERQSKHPVTIQQIAETTGIPLEYLRKIVRQLVRASVLVSIRGRNGGVKIDRNPQDISLREIIEAIGERLDAPCLLDSWPNPQHPKIDLARYKDCCDKTRETIRNLYETTTLADIVNN